MRSSLALSFLLMLLPSCTTERDTAESDGAALLGEAEALIDAFYSFDANRLNAALTDAEDSKPSLLYYQGWAEGGNYEIVERQACQLESPAGVSCSIMVKDDPMLALGVDFFVTDTFQMRFDGGRVVSVETSSNDLPVYYEARDWVMQEVPELIAEPCEGFFDGGPTPGACAAAMAEGYRRFAATRDIDSP